MNWIDMGNGLALRLAQQDGTYEVHLQSMGGQRELVFSRQEWRGIIEFARSASIYEKREGVTSVIS